MKGKVMLIAATALLGFAQEKQPAVVSIATAEHYTWGDCCDGWYLVRTPDINVIQERMPANTSETLHLHHKARQFFFVLSGVATVERGGTTSTVHAGEGVEVPPGTPHKVANRSGGVLELLVTSQPPSHDDRVEVPK